MFGAPAEEEQMGANRRANSKRVGIPEGK